MRPLLDLAPGVSDARLYRVFISDCTVGLHLLPQARASPPQPSGSCQGRTISLAGALTSPPRPASARAPHSPAPREAAATWQR